MGTTTKSAPKKVTRLSVSEINVGDVFSEVSHYTYLGKKGSDHQFKHHSTDTVINLDDKYIENLLNTANQHHKEVEVGKEDKHWTESRIQDAVNRKQFTTADAPAVGDVMVPGIRTIWENIHSAHVFQVCYQKQDSPLSAKKLTELRDAQIATAIKALEKAQKNKSGVTATATEEIRKIQENPILPVEPGEMRTLTGYKVQFTSRDGKYNCVDMAIPKGENNIRPVNINTLAWIIFDGVKYIVK